MPEPSVPIRLLLVADDAQLRTLLRRRFTRFGYEVMEAGDAAKALSLIGMIPFNLLLLDIDMDAGPEAGGVGGFEILRRMRESRGPLQLPIIALTSASAREDAVEALNLGANDHLTKPVDIEVAYARAEMQVRRKRGPAGRGARRGELEASLARLQETVIQAQNTSARLSELGHEARTPLVGVLRAASVLTRLCETPELQSVVKLIDAATGALESLISQSLEGGERRSPVTRDSFRVLCADDDAATRLAIRNILHAAAPQVELVEVAAGLQAALAAEARVFDLVIVNLAAAEAIAGIRAIRRYERQAKARRTPVLAIAADGAAGAQAVDAGADLHVGQAIDAETLLSAVARAISRQSDDLSAVA